MLTKEGQSVIGSFDHEIRNQNDVFRIPIKNNGYKEAKCTISLTLDGNDYEGGLFRADKLISYVIIWDYLYDRLSFKDFKSPFR